MNISENLNFLQLLKAKDFCQFCSNCMGKDDTIHYFSMYCFKVKGHRSKLKVTEIRKKL